MKLSELKNYLYRAPDSGVVFSLPDGRVIPAHFHVTEVGHVTKRFIDCGGTTRTAEACVLQTWVGSNQDDGHRLTAGRLAKILGLSHAILPSHELSVEVEHEDPFVSQFPIDEIVQRGPDLLIKLGLKHTDCLAKERCGVTDRSGNKEGDDDFAMADQVDAPCCSGGASGGKCCG
jgi:hypothetical protein